MSEMTREQRARRYLQASMNAGYTGLPDEHREAYEAQMRAHVRAYKRVAEHALVGADRDFDKPLSAGEREHQAHLREQAGLSVKDVEGKRKELREGEKEKPTRPKPKPVRAGARAGASYYRAKRAANAVGLPTSSVGSTALEATGVAIGLVLAYLVLSPNGSTAFASLLNGVASALRLFIAPVDPLNLPKSTPAAQAPYVPGQNAPEVYSPRKQVEIRSKGKAFGPEPGTRQPFQTVGGAK